MWPFNKKEPEIVVQEVIKEVPVYVDKVIFPKKEGSNFRRGMWVVSAGRVGILFRFEGNDKAVIHLVNEQGETYQVENQELRHIRQARKREVPACRKGEIDKFDYPE